MTLDGTGEVNADGRVMFNYAAAPRESTGVESISRTRLQADLQGSPTISYLIIMRQLVRTSLAVTVLLGTTIGCVTLDEEKVAPDAPVILTPLAEELRGRTLDDVRVWTSSTVASGPLDAQTVERAARRVRPAVVSLYFKSKVKARVRLIPIEIPGLGFPVSLPGTGLGSGFIVHPDGYVLTNNHVVKDAVEIRAVTAAGIDLGVQVIARDPVFDLALLRLVGVAGPFPVLPLGDSDRVAPGSWSIAVGNPLGLGHTVTLGIVSQTGRHLSGVDPKDGREIDFIQMDTAINHGSSGGPLVTLTGACIGVNTAGFDRAQSIGFAVPSKQVEEFLADVLAGTGVAEE